MFGGLRRSFPAKLVVAGLLVLTVVGAYAAVTAADTTEQVRDGETEELVTDARQASATTAVWLDRVESDARTLAAGVVESGAESAVADFAATRESPAGVVGFGYASGGSYAAATADGMAGATPPAVDGSGVRFSAPYTVSYHDNPVVAMVVPAEDGTVVAVLDVHGFSEALGPNHENVVYATADRTIVGHHNTSMVGTTHRDVGGTIPALADGEANATAMVMGDRGMVMAFAPVDGAPWTLMVHESTAAAFGVAGQVQSGLVGILFMGLVGLVVVGATVGSTTVISIKQISRRAEQMAGGDLDVPLETRRVDEFGTMYDSLATMRDNLQERIEDAEQAQSEAEQARQEAEQAQSEAERERQEAEAYTEQLRETAGEYATVMQAAAAGDLTQRLDTEGRSDVMGDIGEEFNTMLAEIEETTGALVAFAEDVGTTAEDVERQATEVQSASERVAASIRDIQTGARDQDESLEEVAREVESLSASAEEIAATVDEVADTSEQTAEAAEAGEVAATRALDEMEEVVERTAEAADAIEALDEEMAQIGEIVDVIGNIADETNMLALNASIEAARAGEGGADDGQGFAVVADEVKALAEETKESADEIEQRIDSVQSRTGDAVETVTETREAVQATAETVADALTELETIAERVEENDTAIQEINSVTGDQAESAQSASRRIDDVADISRDTVEEATEVSTAADQQTAAVEDVRAEVADLRGQAESLQDLLAQFTVGDARGAGGLEPTDAGSGTAPASADGGRMED
jgi:methyl-accepting chemotaxis protein